MSAAARAEARRKAILSRGSDRLAKLTTSARGEDAPAYMHDGSCTFKILPRSHFLRLPSMQTHHFQLSARLLARKQTP